MDTVLLCQYRQRARYFGVSLLRLPAEVIAENSRQFIDRFTRDTTQHGKHRSSQQEIVNVDDFFMLQHKCDFAARIIRQREEKLVCTAVHKCRDGFGAGAIALEEKPQALAGNTCPGGEGFDLSFKFGFIARILAPATDG